jgi:uncharacterized protein involved in response to NO
MSGDLSRGTTGQGAAGAPAGGFALWQLGFRPLYLAASAFAALSVLLWALQYSGALPFAYLRSPVWHAHEMLFGYALAVIAGFLFTAVRNWTQQDTPRGALLAAIVALWLAGRILVLTPFGAAAAVANTAFPLAVAAGIGVPLARSGNRRNYFFVLLLTLLALAVAATHLVQLGLLSLPPWAGVRLGLDVVLFVIAVMAGRVVPMFTNNGVPGAQAGRLPWLERSALGAVLLLGAADCAGLRGTPLAALLAAGAALHLARWLLWQPHRSLRNPLVWVLHAGYAWVPVHLALRALSELQQVAAPLATHALTIGAIGGLTIGMMTRTARGHTGRPLRADALEVTSYLLVLAAALTRVFLPMLAGGVYLISILLSGLLWSAGFGLYAVHYWPILTRPRLDGRPG